ncbi:hypothetical protein FA13DRAFT_1743814 [Coprinellus micaceus]|uniref:Uncharacterized protein n=1 Tax=Coprinellus micaceus TaxID=71717 RepID=A0A4Y7SEK2_COPMI|nr:hypothetical protein FA13DRAFT_1743814 [Coprinellus micaceus]
MHLDPADASVIPVHLPDLSSLNAQAAAGPISRASGAHAGEDGWSSDEDSGDDLGGLMRVRTKEDPPSEATMERMEEWGRPVSPYPGVRRLSVNGQGEGEEGLGEFRLPVAPHEEEVEPEAREEEEKTPRRRNTLDVQKLWEDAHLSPPQQPSPSAHHTAHSHHPSPNAAKHTQDPSSQASRHEHLPASKPDVFDQQHDNPPSDISQEDEEEEAAVRMSLSPDDDAPKGPVLATPKPVYPSPTESPEGERREASSPIQPRESLPTQQREPVFYSPKPARSKGGRPSLRRPKGAFAFDDSSSPTREGPEKRYEEEYLVQTKGGDDETEEEEWDEEEEEEMEEDGDEEEYVDDEDEEYLPEEEEEEMEEDVDEDEEDIEEEIEEEREDQATRRTFAEAPVQVPRGAFAFHELSSPAPESSLVHAQASQERTRTSREAPAQARRVSTPEQPVQARRLSAQQTPMQVPRPTFKVVPPSSSPEREQEEGREASSSPAVTPETPAPKPFQARRVLVEEHQDEQVLPADDDDDALDEAIVEELATPKNARELPYYDHYTPIHKTPFETREHVAVVRNEPEDEEDSESDLDVGMVKIISADPRAAARAAAILKQYDYECYTKLAMKQLKTNEKKRRYSSVDDLSQSSTRVSKSASRETADRERRRRRSSLGMGVIGDTVVIPGSPRVSLPELLEQVEVEVRRETPSVIRKTLAEKAAEQRGGRRPEIKESTCRACDVEVGLRDPTFASRVERPETDEHQERPWTKEEWKLLDSCLTDERLGGLASPSIADMKPVDAVDIECVLDRFGSMEIPWTSDMLRQRIKALQKKQRAGKVAPPSSTPLSTPSTTANTSISTFAERKRLPSMEVPDFTPLGRRAKPPRKSRPSKAETSFGCSISTTNGRKSTPTTLLAPRYSHLLDEARAISADISDLSMGQDSSMEDDAHATTIDAHSESAPAQAPKLVMEMPKIPQADQSSFKTPTTSLRKRLSGIFFSYMPTLTAKTAPPPRRTPQDAQPGLPLPPPEVLQKSRTVKTPAKVPLPKPVPLKQLVELNPAPQPKPSMIPRWNRNQEPKRLVSLQRIPPPPTPGSGTSNGPSRPRRSSGASVKDLVKGFEELGARLEAEGRKSRPNSALSMRSDRGMIAAPGTLMGLSRPGWKP